MTKHLPRLYETGLAMMGEMPSDRGNFHLTAIFEKSRLISLGINNFEKSHPRNLQLDYRGRNGQHIGDQISIHSELAAVLKLRHPRDHSRLKLVNLRIRKNGNLSLSKPCSGCSSLIKQLGFREVWYTNRDGELVQSEKLSNRVQ